VDQFSALRKIKNDGGEDSATGQCGRAFNKLALTFAAQVETLKRYRGSGEQFQVGSILRRAALR
jgi:hypothetical protein